MDGSFHLGLRFSKPLEPDVRFPQFTVSSGILRGDLDSLKKIRDSFFYAILVQQEATEIKERSRVLDLTGRLPGNRSSEGADCFIRLEKPRVG